jgi:hypothetical protein
LRDRGEASQAAGNLTERDRSRGIWCKESPRMNAWRAAHTNPATFAWSEFRTCSELSRPGPSHV